MKGKVMIPRDVAEVALRALDGAPSWGEVIEARRAVREAIVQADAKVRAASRDLAKRES